MARLACSAMRILPAGLLLSVLAVILSGCINLERFRHEKYSCTNNRAGVDEVIIRRAKKGAEVKNIFWRHGKSRPDYLYHR